MTAAVTLDVEEPVTLTITAPFDVSHAPDLRDSIQDLIASGGGPIVLDLSGSSIGDSTGFAALMSAPIRAARAGRSLRFIGADARTRRLVRRAGHGRLLLD